MQQGYRQALISSAALLVAVAALWAFYTGVARFIVAMEPVPPAVRYKTTPPPSAGHQFTRAETLAFLDAARKAEDIADPLQRCLAYPDPPGSRWNHAAVMAYCKYRFQPLITFAQMQQLIESDQASKLDKLLAQALHQQMTDPDAAGRLDRIFEADFRNGSFDIRPILDAWKRQSPNSAFAYAASGMAYEEMAYKARGGGWIVDTPQDNLVSMDRLAVEADADLQRALQLNPKVTPIYTTMINLGGLSLGREYARAAATRGLAVAPADLAIYYQLVWLEEPKWGGSLDAMAAVTREARGHAAENPLLDLQLTAVDVYRVDNCGCTPDRQFVAYSGIAEHLIGYGDLGAAGDAAKESGHYNAQAIYYSEALRFNPDVNAARSNRMYALVGFGKAKWAVEDGNRILARSPDDEYAAKARGLAYFALQDLPQAQRDFRTATTLDPKDMWAWGQLGRTYATQCEWDKTWQVGSRLVEQDPAHSDGWLLRAAVQAYQPRPGLKATITYISDHFGTDSAIKSFVGQMEPIVKWRAERQAKAASDHGAERKVVLLPPWYKQCRTYAAGKFATGKTGG